MIFLLYLSGFWRFAEFFGFVLAGLIVMHVVQTFFVKNSRDV